MVRACEEVVAQGKRGPLFLTPVCGPPLASGPPCMLESPEKNASPSPSDRLARGSLTLLPTTVRGSGFADLSLSLSLFQNSETGKVAPKFHEISEILPHKLPAGCV